MFLTKMKVVYKNFKAGDLKVQTQSLDDLWYLSNIIDESDLVSGKTFRKIRIGQEPNVKVVKKPVFLSISVEKVEFHKYSNSLRVSGKVAEGTEEVPKGSYHTFDVDENTVISIHKEVWYKFHISKVEDAAKEVNLKVLIVVLDREEVTYALLKNYGYEILSEEEGDVRKKEDEGKEKESTFYPDIATRIKEYVGRFEVKSIVIASPAFWKEELQKIVKKKYSELSPMITLATCNNTGNNGVDEVLKRDEVKTVFSNERSVREMKLVESLLEEISKDRNFAYGFGEVKSAADAGAVKELLVADELIRELREKDMYADLDAVMKAVDRANGEVHIISTDHDGGKKLKGLGGIGAILRYKLNY